MSPRKITDFETKEQFKLEATQPGTYNGKLYLTTSAVNFTCLEQDSPRRRWVSFGLISQQTLPYASIADVSAAGLRDGAVAPAVPLPLLCQRGRWHR